MDKSIHRTSMMIEAQLNIFFANYQFDNYQMIELSSKNSFLQYDQIGLFTLLEFFLNDRVIAISMGFKCWKI